ncbi:hypothetical protein OsI_33965 [Oryza sativa Indica Group]|uniref:Uncharacterized protein n=1 Tax=Oryza sativa subsp. indica TaxID=39946 RepID=B8BHD8_ORYSI|nr:hypothetical protein OsI_33965 [Oryza sativa Indica Group]
MARRGGRVWPMTTGSWTVNTRAATAGVVSKSRTKTDTVRRRRLKQGEVAVGSIVEE